MKDCCRSIDILITGLVPRCHHRETQGSPDVEGFYRLCLYNDFQECSELSVLMLMCSRFLTRGPVSSLILSGNPIIIPVFPAMWSEQCSAVDTVSESRSPRTHRSRGRWLPAARRRLPEPGEYKERAGRGKQLVLLSDQRQPRQQRQHGGGRGQGEVCLANTGKHHSN